MIKVCKYLMAAGLAALPAGAVLAQSADGTPLFKQVIADEAKEQIEAEKKAAPKPVRKPATAPKPKKKAAPKPAAAPKPKVVKVAPLTNEEKTIVGTTFAKCYKQPSILQLNPTQRVEIVVKLSKQGFLTSSPLLVRTNAAIKVADGTYKAARKALFSCQPYKLPVATYASWKEVNITLQQNKVSVK